MFKRIVPLVAVLALLVPCLLVPASAVSVIDYNDYITDVTVDGDNDLVTVTLPLSMATYRVYENDVLLLRQTGGTEVSFSVFGGSPDYEYAFEFGCPSGSYIDLSNIPNGTSISWSFIIDYDTSGDPWGFATPSTSLTVRYLNDDGSVVAKESAVDVDGDGSLSLSVPNTYSYSLSKPSDAVAFNAMWRVNPFIFHADEAVVTITPQPVVMTFSISSLYRLQQETGKTNEILTEVEKQLEANGEKLDQIINGEVTPVPPAGSDVVGDLGSKEDSLLNDTAAGREEFNDILGSSAASLELYTTSFAFLSACMNPLFDIPWVKEILVISLGLGTTGFLLNLGFSVISKAGDYEGKFSKGAKSSGKGGK